MLNKTVFTLSMKLFITMNDIKSTCSLYNVLTHVNSLWYD